MLSKDLLAKVGHSILCLFVSVLTLYLAVGRHELTCAAIEYVTVTPPSGQTCQDYLSQYINNNGGYVTNPGAVDNCHFCAFRTTDQFLATNSNIFYDHHWRNLGFFCIYVAFNVRRH
jgi:ATP-binding cassette subfamily G (WHITE) protein 2 (SNQ2)